jgi:chromosome segregation ATPase
MTEVRTRDVPTVEALVEHVREGVAEIVRDALEEAEHLREQADEKLQRYDGITSELAALRLEKHSLKHELQDLPARVHVAALDSLAVSYVGEDPDSLQSRYVTARERLPVVESRIARLENELANLFAGGSRPSKVSTDGGQRRLVKHNAREPILDTLNETASALERLRADLPDVVKDASDDILKERDSLRDGQNQLWGLAKR